MPRTGWRKAESDRRLPDLVSVGLLMKVFPAEVFDAVIGPYTTSESALSVELLGRLRPGMLCLADRGFYSFTAWENACRTGADLLWRVKDNLILDPVKDLPDGSFLADVFHSTTDRARRHPARAAAVFDRVAEHPHPGPGPA